MKVTLQVVENSDRFHVSLDHVPQSTFLFDENSASSKELANMTVNSFAYKLAVKLSEKNYKVKLLPQQIK